MESQYVYQRGRSTEAVLYERTLVQKIEGSLNQKQFALGVLDIDGTFDNASFGSMDAASMGLF
jgi:hypothetical protein